MESLQGYVSELVQLQTTQGREQVLAQNERAFFLAYTCMANFSDAKTLQPWMDSLNAKYKIVSTVGASCIGIDLGDTVIVSWRGVQPKILRNLYTMLELRKVPYLGTSVHSGFAFYASKLRSGVEQMLKEFNPDGTKQVFFTGHSMGGALACLSALYHKPDKIVTFGCPTFISKTAPLPAFTNLTHYVNGRDFVPWLPPYGFVRPGVITRFKADGGNIFTMHGLRHYARSVLALTPK